MNRSELEHLQLERVRAVVSGVYDNVPFYHELFLRQNVSASRIKTLDDLRKLPFTSKADFRDNYPFGLLAVPKDQIARLHASSGTTGKQIVGVYTRRDLDTWAEIIAAGLVMSGVTRSDVIQNAQGYGLFTGGLGFHHGVREWERP